MIEERIKAAIRDVPDFPKQGIIFKDIMPILKDQQLCNDIVDEMIHRLNEKIDAVLAVESRGFFFGMLLANKMKLPFVPVRKKGKLPGKTLSVNYDLEYGTATVEIHKGMIKEGDNILIHDDLLATGGTALAAAKLTKMAGAKVSAFAFIVTLEYLNGLKKLAALNSPIISLSNYNQ
ncbi:MAG: adenine phosphoribosyltransferase [Bacteroidetes bacterium]|nr:adenine phosphoribosyltransferase [Bacteroidota bacterium]